MLKKNLENNRNQNELLRKLAGKVEIDSKNVLMKYSGKKGEEIDEGVVAQIPVYRKDRNNLSNINSNDSKGTYNSNTANKTDYTDLNILPAQKYKTEGMGRISNDDISKLSNG
jgi:hypothetical protein